MSRLQLAVGLPDSKATAQPHLVYLGRSGVELRAALDRSPWPRHLIVHHVVGIPKHNSRAAANAAALAASPAAPAAPEVASPAAPAAPEVAGLREQLAAAQARIAELEQHLSGRPGTPPATPPPAPPRPRR